MENLSLLLPENHLSVIINEKLKFGFNEPIKSQNSRESKSNWNLIGPKQEENEPSGSNLILNFWIKFFYWLVKTESFERTILKPKIFYEYTLPFFLFSIVGSLCMFA